MRRLTYDDASSTRHRLYDLPVAAETEDALTIDELARRIGMTVRNIRAHQSRGLLPAPEVRGRTGYYGPDHVARLELIQELQADGFNLDLIRRLLDGAGGSSKEVLRFKHALGRPFVSDEQPRQINLLELAEEWGTTDLSLLEQAMKVGLVRQREDATFELDEPAPGCPRPRAAEARHRSQAAAGDHRQRA